MGLGMLLVFMEPGGVYRGTDAAEWFGASLSEDIREIGTPATAAAAARCQLSRRIQATSMASGGASTAVTHRGRRRAGAAMRVAVPCTALGMWARSMPACAVRTWGWGHAGEGGSCDWFNGCTQGRKLVPEYASEPAMTQEGYLASKMP
jgi:hypothetical protein